MKSLGTQNGLYTIYWSALHGFRAGDGCPDALVELLDCPEVNAKMEHVANGGPSAAHVGDLVPGVRVVAFSQGSDPTSRRECDVVVAVRGDLLQQLDPQTQETASLPMSEVMCRMACLGQWAWTREQDVIRARDDLIATFSEQLSESYEHISLLLYVGRFMNHVTNPLMVIQTVAQEVRRTMKYGWLAMVMLPDRGAAQSLAGSTTVIGDMPCSRHLLDRACAEYARVHPADAWTRVVGMDDPTLGAIAQSEILIEPVTHRGRTVGMVVCGNKGGRKSAIDSVDIQILDAVADLLGVFHDNLRRHEDQVAMFLGTVGSLTAAIDAKDAYTKGHSERVAWGARELALAIGLDEQAADRARLAGLLHDIGKIGVPESVLTKKGRLTEGEFDLIKRHPRIGFDILRGIPSLEDVLPGVLHHHERWDGKGYPTGAAGEEISLLGRILAVADVFDALSSDRAYRKALARDQVLAEIERSSGTHFDPRMARAFLGLDFSEFDRLLRLGSGEGPAAQRPAA
ncbi:MAG: HD-GYP domain-containing protein [Phycisphaeraceae bacterium]|nr:HD-GYP domain-containing protein [Phycisphaeraceae bacterium]